MNKLKSVAVIQVLVLLIGIVAISYALGSEIGFVSAAVECNSDDDVGNSGITNGLPSFCYGGSEPGYHIYSVTSVTTITRDDGITYTKNGDDWNWQGATSSGIVSADNQPAFYGLANTAVGQYSPPQAEPYPSSAIIPTDAETPLAAVPDGTYFMSGDGGKTFIEIPQKAVNIDPEGGVTINEDKLSDKARELIRDTVGAIQIYETGKKSIEKIGAFAGSGEPIVKAITETAEVVPGFWDTFTGSFLGGGEEGFFLTIEGGPASVFGYIAQTFAVAAVTVLAIHYAADYLGASDRNLRGITTTAGITAGGVSIAATISAIAVGTGPPGWAVGVVVAGVTGIYTLLQYQNYAQESFTFQPTTWQPQDGGADCNECNDLRYGCNEYQCHSFGKDCVLLNEGTSDENCAANDPNDRTPPTIEALEGVLGSDDYEYRDSGIVSPPERGVKIFNIENQDGCLPAFSSVVLGIRTNEAAECKIDVERRQEYNEMFSQMSAGATPIYDFTHTVTLPNSATPSVAAMNHLGWDAANGRQHEFYMRCKDNNGNTAPMNFIIEFCVDDGPDTSAPEILGTNYLQESYIQNGQTSVPLEVYTNEPATCKWDYQNLDYDTMANAMTGCSQTADDYFTSFTYGCSGELTGLQDGVDNQFYIKCKNQPWLEGQTDPQGTRIANTDPYILTLKGSIPLELISISVDGQEESEEDIVIKDSTDTVKVTLEARTAAGAEDGLARCSYEVGSSSYDFYNGGSVEYVYPNTQELWLPEGDYSYPITCEDRGGNIVEGTINFEVETDLEAPRIIRAYYENNDLNLVTSELAECVYSIDSCTYIFEDGVSITSSDNIIHSHTWNTNNNLYVKCRDEYGNQPISGCSMILRPFEFF